MTEYLKLNFDMAVDKCVLMPFDGYQDPVSMLLSFLNPEDAGEGHPIHLMLRLSKKIYTQFDMGLDLMHMLQVLTMPPATLRPNPICLRETHSVLVCKGLYFLHDAAGWEEVADFFDLTIFVDANLDLCVERLKERNKCITGYSPVEIDIWCNAVDPVNAMTVIMSKC
jgi:hypothetical protein